MNSNRKSPVANDWLEEEEDDWSDEIPSSEDYFSEFSDQEGDDLLLPASFPPKAAAWKFSQKNRSQAIECTDSDFTAVRRVEVVKNPIVITTQPLLHGRSHFRIQIKKLGRFIGIGVCDLKFPAEGGKTLGRQRNCINCGYFWQSEGINRMQMIGEGGKTVSPLQEGDLMDILVDFDLQRIYYFVNHKLQGYAQCKVDGKLGTEQKLVEGRIWPCVQLGYESAVTLRNDKRPTFLGFSGEILEQDISEFYDSNDISEPEQDKQPFEANVLQLPTINYHDWQWSTFSKQKSKAIAVSEDGFSCWRVPDRTTMNPAIFGFQPMSSKYAQFKVQIVKLGEWVSIGIAHPHFQLENGVVLGTTNSHITNEPVTASYFFQKEKQSKLQTSKGKWRTAEPLEAGDFVDIVVDFANSRVYFFKNNNCIGFVSSTVQFEEGFVFPCASMSVGTILMFANDERLMFSTSTSETVYPTIWRFDTTMTPHNLINVDEGRLTATRGPGTGDTFMSVRTSHAFRKGADVFLLEIVKLGDILAVGVADLALPLVGRCLGIPKSEGVWFWDNRNTDAISKILVGESSHWTVPLRVGDVIMIRCDFFRRRIRFYLNGWVAAEIHKDEPIQEGSLFPTVTLSHGSQVLIRNPNNPPQTFDAINLAEFAGKLNLGQLEKIPQPQITSLLQYLSERYPDSKKAQL